MEAQQSAIKRHFMCAIFTIFLVEIMNSIHAYSTFNYRCNSEECQEANVTIIYSENKINPIFV